MDDLYTLSQFSSRNLMKIGPTKLISLTIFIVLLCWYIKYLWSRRRLYLLARKIPGPLSLPIIGSLYILRCGPKAVIKTVFDLDKRYPKLMKFWFGQHLVVFVSEPKYLGTILKNSFSRDNFVLDFGRILVGDGLITAPVHIWKVHRKIMNSAFNMKILQSFVKTFATQSNVLTKTLEKFSLKGEFNILPIVNRYTLDIICETIVGVNINAQTTGSEYLDGVERILQMLYRRVVVPWQYFDFIFNMTEAKKEQMDIIKNISEFNEKIITSKRNEFEKTSNTTYAESIGNENNNADGTPRRKAFLDILMEYSNEGYKFNDKQLRDEINTFVMAGSDSTADTICFLLTLLGMHSDVQQKVYEEVIDVIGPTNDIEYTHLPKLKYTEMVIKETMRIFPIIPFVFRTCSEDIDIGDVILPESTMTVISAILVHRNPKYWPDPMKFNPNRFSPEKVAEITPYSYIPFLSGPRNCIGQTFAMMSMKVTAASILRKFKIYSSYKCVEDIELTTDILLRPTNGFKVRIEPRN